MLVYITVLVPMVCYTTCGTKSNQENPLMNFINNKSSMEPGAQNESEIGKKEGAGHSHALD